MGYRLDLDGKIIAYCPDTGICDNAVKLAEDADLLITECSFKPGEASPVWPHLNPQDAANIAERSRAKLLALTHFDAGRYKSIQERLEAVKSVKNFDKIIVGKDDLILQI
jgi:ribonuclease BN (tRNA processing enzyme)